MMECLKSQEEDEISSIALKRSINWIEAYNYFCRRKKDQKRLIDYGSKNEYD